MNKQIPTIIAFVVIILCSLTSYTLLNYQFSKTNMDVLDGEGEVGVSQTTSQHHALSAQVVAIYQTEKATGKNLKCLEGYTLSPEGGVSMRKNCPEILDAVTLRPDATVSNKGIDQLLRLKVFEENPLPISKYIAAHRNDPSEIVQSLYQEFLMSNELKKDSYFAEAILENTDTRAPAVVDIKKFSEDTDVAIQSNLYESGAYNIYGPIYKITFGATGSLSVEQVPIISVVNNKLLRIDNLPLKEGYLPDVTNANFLPDDNNLYINNFLPFGAYPCNIQDKYEFFGDRFVLVSSSQAKGCESVEIVKPEDIPADFDETRVEISRTSPQMLQLAKKLPLK